MGICWLSQSKILERVTTVKMSFTCLFHGKTNGPRARALAVTAKSTLQQMLEQIDGTGALLF